MARPVRQEFGEREFVIEAAAVGAVGLGHLVQSFHLRIRIKEPEAALRVVLAELVHSDGTILVGVHRMKKLTDLCDLSLVDTSLRRDPFHFRRFLFWTRLVSRLGGCTGAHGDQRVTNTRDQGALTV